MTYDVENIVVGGGVIGLAVARELAVHGREVILLERHGHFGEETSSRNSEVIHAGIYYPKDSLKAKFCVEGKERLYQYCNQFNIPHKAVGKLIVATQPDELQILDAIAKKAIENGVDDLTFLNKEKAQAMEPALSCEGALLSPSTGIIDTHQYMLSLAGEVESYGGALAYHSNFDHAVKTTAGFNVTSGQTEISCKNLINSGGLGAQDIAQKIDGLDQEFIPERHLAKGSYFTMHMASPFKHLIYPVPNTASLGIHVTIDLAGQIRFGPDQEWVDEVDYEVDLRRAEDFYAAIRRYYPELPDNSLIAAYSGMRPKTQTPTGSATDFDISSPEKHAIPGLVNLFGMESPGLTSSLAIGRYVREILDFK